MNRNVLLFLMVLLSWSGLSFGTTSVTQTDVTSQFSISKSGFVLNRSTNTYNSTITLTNTSGKPILAPVYLVFQNISVATVQLTNSTGALSNGNPYISLKPSIISPNQSLSVVAAFSNPKLSTFTYQTSVLGVISPPLNVSITSPNNGDTIQSESITIQGMLSYAGNLGVTVSGGLSPAVVTGNNFIASNVPLQPGQNTITVTATDVDGVTSSTNITVTSTGAAPFAVNADSDSGLGPLAVNFTALWQSQITPVKITADFNGDGTIDLTSSTVNTPLQYTYQAAGLYQATFTISDAKGNIYSAITPITVLDKTELDQKFQALWSGFIGNLSNGSITTAALYFNIGMRNQYQTAFAALQNNLPNIVASFSPINLLNITSDYGEYAVTRIINGQSNLFLVYFRQGSDGVYRIESM